MSAVTLLSINHRQNDTCQLVHNKLTKFLHLVSFLLFTKYNNLYPPLGCTHHTPYFIYTPIKLASFENIINFALKNSNLALHGIYVLCKIKYPIASGGLCPPDPLLQRYNFRISPSPQKILDPPLDLQTVLS